jgi:hypothetical protein
VRSFLIETGLKIFNLQILAYALARYDACENGKSHMSVHVDQMELVHNDETLKTGNQLKDTNADMDMEISSNDDNIFNIDNFMDTDEMDVDDDKYAFLVENER